MDKLFSTIFSSVTQVDVQLSDFLIIIGASFLIGVIISVFYLITHKNETYSASFPVTILMLPIIVAVIIRLVGTNVASALSLGGVFTLVRFRTTPADSKDVAYVFFALGSGLACGLGYIGYGILFTVILCVILLILKLMKFGIGNERSMVLRISVPEDINYENVFEETLNKYTEAHKLMQIRTSDFGAVFEVRYAIQLKKNVDSKEFLDEIRTKNGNLNIIMKRKEYEVKVA